LPGCPLCQPDLPGPAGIGDASRKLHHVMGHDPIPSFAGNFPVVGSWIISGKHCGIGIREDKSLIIKDASRFLPHVIID
jgi:hypothetical protein